MASGFGSVLKEWRQVRRMSQMDLALSAGVSARHVSFLETGRSQPSRGMILRLSEELNLPAPACNQLLSAAGLTPAFARRPVDDAELAPLRLAAQEMMDRHDPYPAMMIDRHWRLQKLNQTAGRMLAVTGITAGCSLIEELLENAALRASLENLAEVERLSLARLRTELAYFGRDAVLEEAIARLQKLVSASGEAGTDEMPALIPARYRMGDQLLSFFSTITQFGSTGDLAMSELRIEMLFPADEETRAALKGFAGS